MMSMLCPWGCVRYGAARLADARGLLRVELDDELLTHGHVDLLSEGEVADRPLESLGLDVHPHGDGAVEGVEVVTDDDHVAGLVAELDDVTLAQHVRRDRDPLAVDRDVAVTDPLAGLVATRGEAGAEDHVVETELEHAQEVLAGDALLAGGLDVE